ncbi:MAG: fibronectin type III-like domain-contianing protein, partial [Polyangiaceae bacterium]
EAGASQEVSVRVDPRLLAMYEPARHGFHVAAGSYRISLASSAHDPGTSVLITLPERTLKSGAGATDVQ